MPDKSKIERRKKITQDLRKKLREAFEKSLPMNREIFKRLFEHLNLELENEDCDHTLKLTKTFLSSTGITNIEIVLEWLRENGGYCDCEVLANVTEFFEA